VLLDFDDEYHLTDVAVFNPRFGHLATWDLRALLCDLAQHDVDRAEQRAAFRALLSEGRQ
jgi:hypothetical protein